MRYTTLLVSFLLAGCNAAYIPERPARPATDPLPSATADSARFKLVTGKTATGHRDFANAKKILPIVFLQMERDFYCGCRYAGTTVDFASCGYVPRKNLTRARRIEWEHVVPAWVLGHQRQCWQVGGRAHCVENDPVFQVAEGKTTTSSRQWGRSTGTVAITPTVPGPERRRPCMAAAKPSWTSS